ncbi:MAG TPA: hypothetical protein ENK85_03335 [Saprospiraceae bacterium]|nr:hypothetical protein [Saprospiraceae bacterium]
MNFNYQNRSNNPFGGILSLVFLVVMIIGLFYLFSAFTKFLYWASPVLIIATLVIRYQVVVNYMKQLAGLLKSMPLLGVGAILLTFLLYPFVALHLFLKALRKPIPESERRAQNPFFFGPPKEKPEEDVFTEFEDLTEPEPRTKKEESDDDYDQFFEL